MFPSFLFINVQNFFFNDKQLNPESEIIMACSTQLGKSLVSVSYPAVRKDITNPSHACESQARFLFSCSHVDMHHCRHEKLHDVFVIE